MKKLTKRMVAGVLTLTMVMSIGFAQAASAQSMDDTAAYGSVLAAPTDEAVANRIGFDNEANNQIALSMTENVTGAMNLFSGNLAVSMKLYQNSAYVEAPLILTYNSLDDEDFGFGPGFRTNYSMRIVDNQDNTYTLTDKTGTQYIFRWNSANECYQDIKGRKLSVESIGEYKYVVTGTSTASYDTGELRFDGLGRLRYIVAGGLATNTMIEIDYQEDGYISSVISSNYPNNPLKYEFIYGPPGRITSIHITEKQQTNDAFFSYKENYGMQYMVTPVNPQVINVAVDPATGLVTQFLYPTFTYLPSEAGKLDSVTDGSMKMSMLYGNNQTVLLKNGAMTLYQFDANGEFVN